MEVAATKDVDILLNSDKLFFNFETLQNLILGLFLGIMIPIGVEFFKGLLEQDGPKEKKYELMQILKNDLQFTEIVVLTAVFSVLLSIYPSYKPWNLIGGLLSIGFIFYICLKIRQTVIKIYKMWNKSDVAVFEERYREVNNIPLNQLEQEILQGQLSKKLNPTDEKRITNLLLDICSRYIKRGRFQETTLLIRSYHQVLQLRTERFLIYESDALLLWYIEWIKSLGETVGDRKQFEKTLTLQNDILVSIGVYLSTLVQKGETNAAFVQIEKIAAMLISINTLEESGRSLYKRVLEKLLKIIFDNAESLIDDITKDISIDEFENRNIKTSLHFSYKSKEIPNWYKETIVNSIFAKVRSDLRTLEDPTANVQIFLRSLLPEISGQLLAEYLICVKATKLVRAATIEYVVNDIVAMMKAKAEYWHTKESEPRTETLAFINNYLTQHLQVDKKLATELLTEVTRREKHEDEHYRLHKSFFKRLALLLSEVIG